MFHAGVRSKAAIVIAALSLLLLLTAAGCGDDDSSGGSTGGSTSAEGKPGEGKTIGVILNGFNKFSQCLATGVLEGLKGTDYKFVGAQGNFDAAQEVANFDTMISQGVDGIVVLPNTVQSASRGALAAQRAGIPVVNAFWLEPTPGDAGYIARVRWDILREAAGIGKWITENTEPGEVLLVLGVPGQGYDRLVEQGLREGLEVHGGGKWKLAGVQPGFFTRTGGIKAAQNLMTAHPDAKIIVDSAAEMGNGIASFLKRTNRTDMINITSDGNAEMVPLLANGDIKADSYISGARLGTEATALLRKNLEEDAPRNEQPVDVPVLMTEPDQIEDQVKKDPLCYDEYKAEVQKIG